MRMQPELRPDACPEQRALPGPGCANQQNQSFTRSRRLTQAFEQLLGLAFPAVEEARIEQRVWRQPLVRRCVMIDRK